MSNNFENNLLVRWWLTPKFPKAHIEKIYDKSVGLLNFIKKHFLFWVAHPLKRRVAKYYLVILRTFFGLQVIGITGSAGKTTTKEMLALLLKQKGETVYSYANIDPIYNIPTTILKCSTKTKFLILEMGVEYPNEMDFYLWLARPDIGIITNIFPTHTLFFNNIEGVFKEKIKLVTNLSEKGIAILNGNSELLRTLDGKIKARIVWYGKNSEIESVDEKINSDYSTQFTLKTKQSEEIKIKLPIMGKQFIENALAAIAASVECGVNINQIAVLEKFKSQNHRMQIIKHKSGAIFFDDTYNNNPEAAKETINNFIEANKDKKRVIVFGDMLELGDLENTYHKQIGELIGKSGFEKVICVGKISKITAEAVGLRNNKTEWVSDWQQSVGLLNPYLKKDFAILFKGSRSIGLDNLVSQLSS